MISIVYFIAFTSLVSANSVLIDENWESYKVTFQKDYENVETELYRRVVWQNNMNYIKRHNMEADIGLHTYWLGLNEHADLSDEEFLEQRNHYLSYNQSAETSFISNSVEYLPEMVDWRTKGYVTRVKNQGMCGSCWSFSATGSLEGQVFKKYGKLISLSEQNLIDCSSAFGNNGCGGGLMDKAFRYIRMYGIESEKSYPYEAARMSCRYDRNRVVTFDKGYVDIPKTEADLQIAVANVGPISVAIDASPRTFRFYRHGIFLSRECYHKLNHGVLVVGYGTNNGQDYWLVKNSWGDTWGDGGYIKMARNFHNMCSIASLASYPLI